MAVRLRFQLRSGSEDKKRWGMVEEDRCVLCNGGKAEDMLSIWNVGSLSKIDVMRLISLSYQPNNNQVLVSNVSVTIQWPSSVQRVNGVVGVEEWVNGYEGDDDSRVSLLLGRKVDVN